jgi:hypothetical protein
MDVTLVEYAQDNINSDERGQNEHRLIGQRSLERLGGTLEIGLNTGR